MKTSCLIRLSRMAALLVTASLAACATHGHSNKGSALGMKVTPAAHNLHYDKPATTWDEAFPLGNALLGALVWGDGAPLKLSLDRTDLWDLRPVPEFTSDECTFAKLQEWRKAKRMDDIKRIYDAPYDRAQSPTKIPAGRIEIGFGAQPAFESGELDIAKAVSTVALAGGGRVEAFVHATQPVGMVRARGVGRFEPKLIAPAFSGTSKDKARLPELGYPAPVETSGDTWRAFVQQGTQGLQFSVYVAWRKQDADYTLAWSIASSSEGPDTLNIAKKRVEDALNSGYDTLCASHNAWWNQYWAHSAIDIPNKRIERQWYLDQYKFGAAARADAPPITLQGPWTADNGDLPPWKGDYHHDLNTQLSYWPCYSGNHLEEGLGYLNWLWDIRPNCEAWTQRFFGLPGLNVPGVSSFDGSPLGGWCMYSFSSTAAAWLAQHFYLHWQYSGDNVFLRERAYPYVKQVATFVEAVTNKRDANGLRTLPLSSSPEINDNRVTAWFDTPTNYDLALMHHLFRAAKQMAEVQGMTDEAARWQKDESELPPLWTNDKGQLLITKDYPLPESHRHFSHLMAIYPLGLIDWDGGPEAQRTIRAALDELDRLGTSLWCGYSFGWHAAVAARAHDGARAERALDIFAEAFVLRNGFHCNGDQSGKGYSKMTYRPFTLEGNFAAAAALQEMLLQQNQSGMVYVFAGVPDTWNDVSFRSLRARGGFLVSAERKDGVVRRVEITAGPNAITCGMVSPFSGKKLYIALRPGESVVLESDPKPGSNVRVEN